MSSTTTQELASRLQRVMSEARRLAGVSEDGSPEQELGRLIGELSEHDPAAERLVREHEAALERLRLRFEARSEALARVRAEVSRLRLLTAPSTILARAPAALCAASAFTRALLSLVDHGAMRATAAHFADDPETARRVLEELAPVPIRLEHPLIEAEVVRRRRATIVVDAQLHPRVHRRLSELMGWSAYAAAPLLVGRRLVGVIHADRGAERAPDVLDRDVLWEFATSLAHVYETVSLVRLLRQEREQMRGFLEWTAARSGGLTEAPLRLSTIQRTAAAAPEAPLGPVPGTRRDERTVFEGLLTRRELDVLRLLAEGHSNRAVAEALVISDGTVKFHVGSILRKLRVANRAQAVSRYLRLLGMETP